MRHQVVVSSTSIGRTDIRQNVDLQRVVGTAIDAAPAADRLDQFGLADRPAHRLGTGVGMLVALYLAAAAVAHADPASDARIVNLARLVGRDLGEVGAEQRPRDALDVARRRLGAADHDQRARHRPRRSTR